MTFPGRVSPEGATAALNDITELLDLWQARRVMRLAARVHAEIAGGAGGVSDSGGDGDSGLVLPLREAGLTLVEAVAARPGPPRPGPGRPPLRRAAPSRERSRTRSHAAG